ncbi:MAG: MlaD family protein [Desulfobulbaceae bacterium]|nr:MlaD family protein [Desulfobulbaceae bacterium]
MSRKANPTLIGTFVFGAIILGTIVTLLLAGRDWFQERRQHIMYFEETAQGLQVGAPVVFLGVKVGTVKRIQLGLDETSQRFMVPVTVELAPRTVHTSDGEQIDLQDRDTIRQLVDRGLRARLQMQSLLTGLLYVDLAFHPDKGARFISNDPEISEIPTIPTKVEELSSMLEEFPMAEFLADLSAISDSMRTILSSEALETIPDRLDGALIHLESLVARLDSAADPLVEKIEANLMELGEALEAVRTAMGKLGNAADQVEKFADSDSQLYGSITIAGEELANAAREMGQLAGEGYPAVELLNDSLQEISRAARAMRLLAETLEKNPEALLRGKHIKEGR